MKNGISTAGISEFVAEVRDNPDEAQARYGVHLEWLTGTRSRVRTLPMQLGGHRLSRDFSWIIDEPRPLLGCDQGPNPQEFMLSAVGSCMMVAYSVGASVMGIQLEQLEIQVHGELDLRGFLGVDDEVPVGFREIRYEVTLSGDGTLEQFHYLHEQVAKRSPNRMTVAGGVPVRGSIRVPEPVDQVAQ